MQALTDTWTYQDVPITCGGLERIASALAKVACEKTYRRAGLPVRLVNSFTFPLADQDVAYARVVKGPGINLPDGAPLQWLARIDGQHLGLVRGPTLFRRVLDQTQGTEVRHFFLGGTEETLASLLQVVGSEYPLASVAGAHSPPFRPLTEADLREQDELIAAARPDIVWVGTGTPRQDHQAVRIASKHRVIAIGVGAAFDFASGTKREAPSHLHHSGLEWIFRLATEPRRLWRRYLVAGAWVARRVLIDSIAKAARRVWRPRETQPEDL